jgi:hypothetical protein
METRRVLLAGITRHPTKDWIEQVTRNLTDSESGQLGNQCSLLHDRDAKFSSAFISTLLDGGFQPLRLPARSPNLNAFAETWVRSFKKGVPVEADPIQRVISKKSFS